MSRTASTGRPAGPGPGRADDPERLRSPTLVRFFSAVMARRMRRDFAALRLASALPAGQTLADVPTLRGRPIVVFANHPSWWDAAFIAVLAQRLFPNRRAYAPMQAEALRRYPFMRRCGVFGLQPASRAGGTTLLRLGVRLLSRADTLLCILPQGEFADVRAAPIRLQRGLAALLARVPEAVALPLALDYPFWGESRPEALARIGTPIVLTAADLTDAAGLHGRLETALSETLAVLTADAVARDPKRFETLGEGRVGVGGVYDLWRRLGAWASGRQFDPHHVATPPSARPGRLESR